MAVRKQRSTDAFRRRAVQMYYGRGEKKVHDLCQELGIVQSQLYRWVDAEKGGAKQKDGKKPVAAPPKQAAKHLPAFKERAAPPSSAEVNRLRREIATLKEECSVLKKTIVVFARGR